MVNNLKNNLKGWSSHTVLRIHGACNARGRPGVAVYYDEQGQRQVRT